VLSAGSYLVFGPPETPPEYALEDRPTAIYVDDRANVIPTNAVALRLRVAERVAADLMTNEVVLPERMISPRDTFGVVRARDKHGDWLAIDEIGRAVGAEQVIFVQMVAFRDSPDGVTPSPTAMCRVRVVDVANQRRLYPPEEAPEDERVVQVSLRPVDPSVFQSRTSRLKVYEALAEDTGGSIGRLFYAHVPREPGKNLNPR
jgi:hypothetical protein